MKKILAFCGFALAICSNARASDLSYLLGTLQGYTIVGVFNIEGYIDPNGKRGNDFQGCSFGRRIIFTGNKALTCQQYGYHYAYRPEAIVLARGNSFKMIVDDELYNMTNF